MQTPTQPGASCLLLSLLMLTGCADNADPPKNRASPAPQEERGPRQAQESQARESPTPADSSRYIDETQ